MGNQDSKTENNNEIKNSEYDAGNLPKVLINQVRAPPAMNEIADSKQIERKGTFNSDLWGSCLDSLTPIAGGGYEKDKGHLVSKFLPVSPFNNMGENLEWPSEIHESSAISKQEPVENIYMHSALSPVPPPIVSPFPVGGDVSWVNPAQKKSATLIRRNTFKLGSLEMEDWEKDVCIYIYIYIIRVILLLVVPIYKERTINR